MCDDSLAAIAKAQAEGVFLASGSDAGAAGVQHGEGIMQEYKCFKLALLCSETLRRTLELGQAALQEKFKRH